MKIREGFVSNSSASSFIIAIGKIIDRDKFNEFMRSIDTRVIYGFETISLEDIKEGKVYSAKIKDNNIVISSFTDEEVKMSIEEYHKEDAKKDIVQRALSSLVEDNNNDIIIWSHTSEDIESNEDGYDYDIDLEHFDDDVQDLYCGLKEENGILLVEKSFGAGYNG